MRGSVSLRSWAMVAVLLAGVLALAACGGDPDDATEVFRVPAQSPLSAQGSVYLALGDSVAAGTGASEPAATGYATLVQQALAERYGNDVRLDNLAVASHTTDDVIEQQLPQAHGILAEEQVALITLTVAGDDLYAELARPDCISDPASAACPLEEVLDGVEVNLDTILSDLRAAAGPDVPIVVTTYPNFFSVPEHPLEGPASYALGRLNEVIRACASSHGALVAELETAFDGQADELTHVMDTTMDPHPNDAGHRLIAEAVVAVLDLK